MALGLFQNLITINKVIFHLSREHPPYEYFEDVSGGFLKRYATFTAKTFSLKLSRYENNKIQFMFGAHISNLVFF